MSIFQDCPYRCSPKSMAPLYSSQYVTHVRLVAIGIHILIFICVISANYIAGKRQLKIP